MANCGDCCNIIHQEKVSECRAIRDVILKTVPLRFLVTENKTGNKYSYTESLILTTMCVWVRRGGCIGSCWANRREGDHWGDLGVDG